MRNPGITLLTFLLLMASFQPVFSQGVMDFDGLNDFINVPNASGYIANGPMSLSVWVYPTNPAAGWPDFDGFLGFRNDVNADFYLLQLNSTTIEARFRNSNGTNYDIVYGGLVLNDWNHFVFTYDNTSLKLYHDGASVMSMPASGTISSTTQTLNIGYVPFSANPFYFDGQLDDVSLWNISLNANQVADLYTSCIDLSSPNLKLAYEFNEGNPGGSNSGITSVLDSKNNTNGTISGFALSGNTSNFVTDSKPVSSSSFSLTALSCGPYTSPSGNFTWTSTGLYADTIFASAGCDSIYSIDLTIGTPSSSSTVIQTCDAFASPSGNYLWTSSGIYQDTIANASGCDSIITFDLTIGASSNGAIGVTSCGNYTSPSGNYIWSSSGTYQDTLLNAAGCDSIININLTVSASSSETIFLTGCDSLISPSGNYVWHTSGSYLDTISNAAGCDSVLIVGLQIERSSNSTVPASSCGPYVSPSSHHIWSASGSYPDTVLKANGCYDYLTVNLTLVDNDTAVVVNGFDLISQESSTAATFQWLDCNNNYAPLLGEIFPTFTATTAGSYAVEIRDNGCIDTSACVVVATNLGITFNTLSTSLALYPNPSAGLFTVELGHAFAQLELQVYDLSGKTVYQAAHPHQQIFSLDLSHLPKGMYICRLGSGTEQAIIKLKVQ